MNRLMSDDALQLVSYLFYALFFILAIFLVGPGARDYALAVSTVAALCLAVFGLFAPLRKNKAVSLVPEVLVLIGVFLYLIFFGAMNLLILSFLLVLVATEAYMRSRATYAVMVSAILFLITAFGLFRIEPFTTAAFLNDLVIPIVVILIAALVFRIFSTEARTLRQKNKQISKELGSLTAQTEELNELVNGLSEGLISAGINNKITFLNRAAEKILTAESAELIGKNIDDFFLTATENGKFSVAGEVLKSQKSTKYPNILLFTKGQTFKVSVSAEPVFDKAGEMVGLVILFRDITQERLLDEQKAEFNAVASHELRTPLAVIDGYAFDLLNDKTLKYDAKTKENIMAISEATESLIQLTNDILTITKVENNQLKINLEKTDLKKLITEVTQEFKAPAKAKKIALKTDVSAKLPNVLTDAEKVKEVLTNLVENALKFTPKGSVIIGALENEQQEVRLSVTDTGVGISAADQKKIFQKFYRTENWKTRKTGGTGLGLYISKSLVEQIGGQIGVDGNLDHGSTFWFSLPLTVDVKKRKSGREKKLDEFIKSI